MKLIYTLLLSLFFAYGSVSPQGSIEPVGDLLDENMLPCNPGPANNGGSPNWAIFFNLIAGPNYVDITHMRTASSAAANATFDIEFFIRSGNALGGPVGSGPGSSPDGWTSVGTVPVTQGETGNGISLVFATPVISLNPGDTVGVAMKFLGVGPRYANSTSYTTYWDNNLSFVTGDVRTVPFTTTGSFFTPREFVGEVYYDTSIVPVELTSFTASIHENAVELRWITATELNNSGFTIERRNENRIWENKGFVKGSGTSSEIRYYSFIDKDPEPGLYYYRLKQTDYNGTFEYFDLAEIIEIGTIGSYHLSQNYPNPFNPATTISIQLKTAAHTTLKIYDQLGNEVAVLVNEIKPAGIHKIDFNASAFASGIYYYKIIAGDFIDTKKMILIK